MKTYKLFDYQEEAVQQITDFFSHGGHSTILQLPTGAGKSLTAVEFIKRCREDNKPVYFLTHSKNLLWQFSDHLTEYGVPHGIISSGCPALKYKIQVISAMSLKSRIHLLPEPSYIIAEEAHHSASAMFADIFKYWPHAKILGLTATPERLDGKPLDMYENIITLHQVRWFIDNGYLSDYEYYVPNELDTSGIHRVMGDFNKKELNDLLKKQSGRVGQIVENYKKYADGLPAIAFATSIEDSENIADRFINAGYDMHALHSKMKGDLMKELEKCRNGDISLLSSCMSIGEGTDVKGLTVSLDCRPTQSLTIYLQHVGRVLRTKYAPGYDLTTREGRLAAIEAGGKKKAIILDFSSNYTRHGLPDDEREWSLKPKNKKKTQEKSTLKRCPNCQRPVLRTVSNCPYCNYLFVTAHTTARKIEEKDGELVNIKSMKEHTPQDQQFIIREIARRARNQKQAILIGRELGLNSQGAWFIWRKILKKTGW